MPDGPRRNAPFRAFRRTNPLFLRVFVLIFVLVVDAEQIVLVAFELLLDRFGDQIENLEARSEFMRVAFLVFEAQQIVFAGTRDGEVRESLGHGPSSMIRGRLT